ncbi:hypothetical protein GF327_08825 [Candidatus Woesearchaeota archaeon]|nr:hypothetical protein [Candidatus Woesearchaeota archaeon]
MLQNYNKYRVLQVFFDNPLPEGTGFQLREISRKISLAPTSVKNYLEKLEKEKLIIEKSHRIHDYPVYIANRDNEYFKFLKKIDIQLRIYQSDLINYIDEECMPEVVVLFGSASRGEDTKKSDIDLFVQSKSIDLELEKYEDCIKRKINILYNNSFKELSKELKNNIVNGIILKGYLKIK